MFALLLRYQSIHGHGFQAAMPAARRCAAASTSGLSASPRRSTPTSPRSRQPSTSTSPPARAAFSRRRCPGLSAANPPFEHSIMDATAARIEEFLTASAAAGDQPLVRRLRPRLEGGEGVRHDGGRSSCGGRRSSPPPTTDSATARRISGRTRPGAVRHGLPCCRRRRRARPSATAHPSRRSSAPRRRAVPRAGGSAPEEARAPRRGARRRRRREAEEGEEGEAQRRGRRAGGRGFRSILLEGLKLAHEFSVHFAGPRRRRRSFIRTACQRRRLAERGGAPSADGAGSGASSETRKKLAEPSGVANQSASWESESRGMSSCVGDVERGGADSGEARPSGPRRTSRRAARRSGSLAACGTRAAALREFRDGGGGDAARRRWTRR